MEEKKEVRPIKVEYKCDECETGYMMPNGIALMSYPAQYVHRCSNLECPGSITSTKQYPYVDFQEINADSDGRE